MKSNQDKYVKSADAYTAQNGIYSRKFKTLQGDNKKYSKFYNVIANAYDLGSKIFFSFYGGEFKARNEFLEKIKFSSKKDILEVSIGTGINIQMLPEMHSYYGVDISLEMLKKCRNTFRHSGKSVKLFLAEAEDLPFNDEVFDCVFHVGGINFFNDKEKAIKEMIRVAKPGALIMIVDETDKFFRQLSWVPFLTQFFKLGSSTEPPVKFLPRNVDSILLDTIIGKNYWVLTFRKL